MTWSSTIRGEFSRNPTSGSLGSGGETEVRVYFSPTSAGSKWGTLTITSNDPVTPTVLVSLSGRTQKADSGVISGRVTIGGTSTGIQGATVTTNPATSTVGTDWNGNEIASGVYLYRLTAGEGIVTRKMVLLR